MQLRASRDPDQPSVPLSKPSLASTLYEKIALQGLQNLIFKMITPASSQELKLSLFPSSL